MVEVEKDYAFTAPDGEASLLELFEGRLQLIVGHFMFDPSWEDGCPSCSAGADDRDDRALQGEEGLTFPWYSSHGSDFNYDFQVTLDKAVAPPEDPGDRRQKRLCCTGAGHVALRRLDEARLAGLSAFAATLPTAQCRRLSAALRPILDDLPDGA